MLFGDAVINSERLTVPHYDMKNRGFMLWPLFEIAPTFTFLTASRCAPYWIISARQSPLAGNPLPPFLAFAAIVVIGCPKSLPL